MRRAVGVIGLGAMGHGVAKNLINAGFEVFGCDVRKESVAAFANIGGQVCDTPAALAAQCQVVIILVVNAAQTDMVLFGDDGAAPQLRPGSVVVGAATVAPAYAIELGKRLAKSGVGLIDSPMSGGVIGANEGTLTLLTSGPEAAYEACNDVLDAISSKVYRLGAQHGLGSKIKVINQLLVGVQIAAAAEAMALGLREGVDLELLYDVIVRSAGNSWAFADRVPHILQGRYTPAQTALDIFVKDLGLVLEAARASNFPLPLASTAYQMFATASAAGFGNEDDTAVIKTFPGITLPGA
ncbi:3-hydroxyisobutyrate dehydrogenase [Burkholderia sp. SG-MS1]|uniref:L-threonate dehydrogenase n=1 Tax=Paraburkholderia sp. SG-MS1 TaxID=2023741 RepID=UPI0014468AF2|nr:L-threonate dehydrogenase [Paraburkholderia sp. SG-MS1]NKJ50684.1 3-hydroxyisobutyrate dehydrogenase [Paraburkholderia sp. SG-MS1]